MKIIAVIQARLASTRLPQKVLLEIAGRPMLAHVLERVRAIPGINAVILTTPREDFLQLFRVADFIERAVIPNGWECHDPPDVLSGFAAAAKHFDADIILRLTGDNPLLDPILAGLALAQLLVYGDHYIHNLNPPTDWPEGLDVQVFTREALDREIQQLQHRPPSEREHVGSWLAEHDTVTTVHAPEGLWELKTQRWTVDTPEDLERVRSIFRYLASGDFSWQHTLRAAREAGLT